MSSSRHPRLRVLTVIVEDHPGVLERVASQIRRRGFNIEALSVGSVAEGRSRMTLSVDAGHAEVEQVAKQVDKLLEVIHVDDITDEPIVSRELVVARIGVSGHQRETAVGRISRFGGRVVDAGAAGLVVEFSGEQERVDAFLGLLQPYGITELVRSGPVAIRRNGAR
jgi:acetolactate synthase-1/3 small subunit